MHRAIISPRSPRFCATSPTPIPIPAARAASSSGEKLSCFTDGFFLGKFSLERAGKNMKLAISGADEHVALVPGVDLSSFVVLSPENPEHTLFLLNPAPAKTCAK